MKFSSSFSNETSDKDEFEFEDEEISFRHVDDEEHFEESTQLLHEEPGEKINGSDEQEHFENVEILNGEEIEVVEQFGDEYEEESEKKIETKKYSQFQQNFDNFFIQQATIYRKGKKYFSKPSFEFFLNEKKMFSAIYGTKNGKKCYHISSVDSLIGYLLLRDSSTRFSFFHFIDDMCREECGIVFSKKQCFGLNFRQIRLAISLMSFRNSSGNSNLSKVAKKKEQINPIEVFESILPTLNEFKQFGVSFGDINAIPSVKNFMIIQNPLKVPLISFYKISEDKFQLKFFPPISNEMAFAIAISSCIGRSPI